MAVMGRNNNEIKMFRNIIGDGEEHWWHCPVYTTIEDADGIEHRMVDHEKTKQCNIYQLPDGWEIDEYGEIWMPNGDSYCEVYINEDEDGNLYVEEPDPEDDSYRTMLPPRYLKLVAENIPVDDEFAKP